MEEEGRSQGGIRRAEEGGEVERKGREEGMKKGYLEMCEKKWEEEKGVRGG